MLGAAGHPMVTLSNSACSWLMETRTDTEPLEKEFLTLSEATFMCSFAEDAQRKWEHTAHKQKQGGRKIYLGI